MNKLTRTLVMTGVAVATGATMAAGPATASTTSTARPAAPQQAESGKSTAQKQDHRGRDRIIDTFRSPRTCHKVGRMGVWQDRWERYRCFPVRSFHRGGWALKVYYGWDGGHHGHHGHGGPDFRDHDLQHNGGNWKK
ncbi:hypothetical protein [Actinoplanes sp. DH11]|uniref:hypothetical protein n=1 Tax=Actinoplanes sp. DH11 TaxID=2857011 RepID=UPI001E3A608B|nr:hypothetical protein [Actinoplanes sp. DH11]